MVAVLLIGFEDDLDYVWIEFVDYPFAEMIAVQGFVSQEFYAVLHLRGHSSRLMPLLGYYFLASLTQSN